MDSTSDSTAANAGPEPAAGLFKSLHDLVATVINMVHTRLSLLTTELQEEVRQVARLLAWGVVALLAAMMGLLLAALTVIFVFWDTHRVLAALVMTGVFLVIAVVAALVLRQALEAKPPLLDATLAELAKDRDSLRSRL